MDLKKIEAELNDYGIIQEAEKVTYEGELYNCLFKQEYRTEEQYKSLGSFIVNNMSDFEFVQFLLVEEYLETIYQAVESSRKVPDFLQKIIRYFDFKEYWGFYDYQDIIIFGFRFCENWTAADLEKHNWFMNTDSDYEESQLDYLSWIRTGLSFAGEETEYGRSFAGGEKIRKYASYLDYSVVKRIFEYAEYDDGVSAIDARYRFQMIKKCRVRNEKIRRDMMFRYVYCLYFKKSMELFFENLFAMDGNDIYVNTDDALQNKYQEILCYKSNKAGQISLLAIEKSKADILAFEVKHKSKTIKFRIYLEDDNKLKYETRVIVREFTEIWDKISDSVNNWSKITELALNQELYEIFDSITNNLKETLENESIVDMDKNLEILFVYIKSLRGNPFVKELPFSDEYSYEIVEEENIRVYMVPQKECRISEDFFATKMPFEEKEERQGHISNINALIGKNGSGKTSIATLLMESDIFGDLYGTEKKVKAEYCIVYRVGKNIYYSCTNQKSEWIEVYCENEVVHSYQNTENDKDVYKKMFNTTVVLYHNIVNALDVGSLMGPVKAVQSIGRKDLTTSNILTSEHFSTKFTDILYVMNLMEDIKTKKETTEFDFFEKFDLREIQQVTKKIGREKEDIPGKTFLKEYKKYLNEGKDKNVKFIIEDVSTGESARLLLFARLHSVFHMNREYRRIFDPGNETFIFEEKKRGNYILLLDEIEAFFHPTWQRKIVYDLIAFLEWEEKQFEAFDNVHVILSSNSPFYLSDLPKTKFIRLDKENNWEDSKQTFGENIHTILKESFLLENGLMGEFALKKIERAFSILRNKEHTAEEWEYVNEIMGLVEEPIIKSALQELYQTAVEKINNKKSKLEEYRRQIENIQRKIEELQGEK